MTAEQLYMEFWRATSTAEAPPFESLTRVHQSGWEAVLAMKTPKTATDHAESLRSLGATIHYDNRQWWHDLETGEPLDRNFGEMIALAHSELSEALEGHRKNLMDDHLSHRLMAEVELADAVIRIIDIAEEGLAWAWVMLWWRSWSTTGTGRTTRLRPGS